MKMKRKMKKTHKKTFGRGKKKVKKKKTMKKRARVADLIMLLYPCRPCIKYHRMPYYLLLRYSHFGIECPVFSFSFYPLGFWSDSDLS